MSGAGYRNWTAGDIPTATQFDTFLQEQTVMVFASAAARNAALAAVLAEGMFAVPVDTNSLTVYSGIAWSTTGPLYGAPTSWTPAVVQSGSVTVTNNGSTYSRLGRRVEADFILTVTGSGTASNVITVSLPVTAAFTASHTLPVGVGKVVDVSPAPDEVFVQQLELASATTLRFRNFNASGIDSLLGVQAFIVGLAVGDTLSGTFSYVAAADA